MIRSHFGSGAPSYSRGGGGDIEKEGRGLGSRPLNDLSF